MSIKCNCRCKEPCQPLNSSNRSMIIPVAGLSAYEEWKTYNPDSTWSESEWLDQYVAGSSMYTETEW